MEEELEIRETDNEDEISKLVKDVDTIKKIFDEPEDLLKNLTESFENRSYENILESSRDILSLMEEPTKRFIKVGMAFSISAAGKWVSPLGEAGVDITQAEELISRARDEFFDGEYLKADKTIEKVREMIPDLEEQQTKVAKEMVQNTEDLVVEVKETGADVSKAERSLQQAKDLLEVENYLQVVRLTRDAREIAENAKQQRIQTVSDALLFTRSVIEESKGVGVDITEPENLYKDAKSAFAKEEYQKCSELTKEAEELALKLQDEQFQKVLELKEKRTHMERDRPKGPTQPSTDEKGEVSEESAKEKPAPPGATEEECQTCGSSLRYVAKYDRLWCKQCKKYAPRK